ncbi:hypothetical protein SAMN02744133_10819 [Thalassospira xiamenensis M-5 = DSM 17429]|uniref:Restriction endonuclease type IV Mrr domain-containing protein n=1 Tax=Thalassospira xiamenensis M-5 = DSM 17429 TaxID=1123366 RepID=A0AB72UJK5_9PROT|nr:hypothetical protein [Thalassospira xiamenensis]AJD54299.1 hypothetical protein TH3_21133 [Thalassospira xiamenensis M-5 = DSM 17429]SIT20938.1 hypothetical protein SAMN02744133_10819 [Thalassospira xiamenensis M-5 = DSM 17429]
MGIALSYPTPLNGKDFEQMVRDALQTYWKLPKQLSKLSYEGPGSGKQDGADLLGYEAKGNKVAIQVKLRKGPLSFKDVETDLKKFEAHPWHKKITTFYFATIKSPSSELQRKTYELSEKYEFNVEFYDYKDIVSYIARDPKLLRHYFGDLVVPHLVTGGELIASIWPALQIGYLLQHLYHCFYAHECGDELSIDLPLTQLHTAIRRLHSNEAADQACDNVLAIAKLRNSDDKEWNTLTREFHDWAIGYIASTLEPAFDENHTARRAFYLGWDLGKAAASRQKSPHGTERLDFEVVEKITLLFPSVTSMQIQLAVNGYKFSHEGKMVLTTNDLNGNFGREIYSYLCSKIIWINDD